MPSAPPAYHRPIVFDDVDADCRAQAAGAVLLNLGGKLGDRLALFGGYLLERFLLERFRLSAMPAISARRVGSPNQPPIDATVRSRTAAMMTASNVKESMRGELLP